MLKREDKYKVKSVTDTLGYRTGDQLGAWSYHGLQGMGLNLNTISWIAVPITVGWCALNIWQHVKNGLWQSRNSAMNQFLQLTPPPNRRDLRSTCFRARR